MKNEWEKVTLGEVATISSGSTPSRSNASFWNGTIPWVTTTQIQNNIINLNDVKEFITDDGLKKSSLKIIPKGTLLMAMYGQGKTRGQVGILNFDSTINQACAAIGVSQKVSSLFLYQYFQFKYENIRALSNSGGQKNLSAEIIKSIEFNLPPFLEQEKIVDTLSVWDSAIEKTEKLINLEEKKMSAFAIKLFSGKTKFQTKNRRLGELLEEKFDLSTGSEEVFSVSVHKGLINQIEHLGRSFAAANTDNYNLVKFGCLVYTKSPTGDFPYGIVKQSSIKKDVIVSPLYGVYEPVMNEIGLIIEFFFESPIRCKNYLYPLIQKGAKNTISISNQDFLKGIINFPENEKDLIKVADYIRLSKEYISLLKKQLEQYKLQKQGLMQKLLTGEWRVK